MADGAALRVALGPAWRLFLSVAVLLVVEDSWKHSLAAPVAADQMWREPVASHEAMRDGVVALPD